VLYPQLLRGDFAKLPRVLREFHSAPGGGQASGTVAVRHVNRLLARMAGFPASGEDIPLHLDVVAGEDEEVWTRRFGESVLQSVQCRRGELLLEAIGPVRVFFRVFGDSSGMRFESTRARFWRIPLPLKVRAEARGNQSSWDIQVTVRGVGSYRGVVVPTA
jgi:hypothetical protein